MNEDVSRLVEELAQAVEECEKASPPVIDIKDRYLTLGNLAANALYAAKAIRELPYDMKDTFTAYLLGHAEREKEGL